MDSLGLILVVIAAMMAAYLLLLICLQVGPLLHRAAVEWGNRAVAPFSRHFDESSQARRFQGLEDELDRALGLDGRADDRERRDIVEAAVSAQRIALVNRRLRKAASQCVETHWAIALGLAAVEMAEAARHPLSRRLRQRVIDLAELLSQYLDRYPLLLEAPDLIRVQLGIRWIGPTCATCPYFTTAVSDAPRICPTARVLGHRPPSAPPNEVVEGEIVTDCD